MTIPTEILELKKAYREQRAYAYSLKTKAAQRKNFEKARELQMQIRDALDKVMPEYGYVNTHGMMLETVGGASGIQGVVPFSYSFGRITIYTPDFQQWVGDSDLADNAFGIEPLSALTEISAREPHKRLNKLSGKEMSL